MNSFSSERLHRDDVHSKKFKSPIPILYITPTTITNHSNIVVFVPGLNENRDLIRLMNFNIFDNNYLISYDKMGHGDNTNYVSRCPSRYVDELCEVIKWINNAFPGKKIYLIGESWGAAIIYLFCKKHDSLINGTVAWNMPRKIKDASNKPWGHRLALAPKMLLSIFFGIQTFDYHHNDPTPKLSSNPLFIRMVHMQFVGKENNNSSIAAWWSFKPAWRMLKKLLIKGNNHFYIQSGEDFMAENKILDLRGEYKNFIFQQKGYHILIFEDGANDIIFDTLKQLIS